MIPERVRLLAALLSTLLLMSCQPPRVELRVSLKKGDAWQQELAIRSIIEQTEGEKTREFVQELELIQGIRVLEVSDESYQLSAKFVRVRYLTDDGYRRELYDSKSSRSTPFLKAKPFAALVGASLDFAISPTGRILRVDGGDSLRKKMIASLERPNMDVDPNEKLFAMQIEQQFGDTALIEMLEPQFAVLPDKPVAKGETWVRKEHLSASFPTTRVQTFGLRQVNEEFAAIDAESKVFPNEKGAHLKFGPSTSHFELRGIQTARIKVDRTNGLVVDGEWKLEASGEQIDKTPRGNSRTRLNLRTTSTTKRMSAPPPAKAD